MSSNNLENPNSGETSLKTHIGRVGSVDLYEIKKEELDILAKGSSSDIHLNFAIFSISSALGSASALLKTKDYKYELAPLFFVVICVGGVAFGAYLLFQWSRSKNDSKTIVAEIRKRLPPEFVASPASDNCDPDCEEPKDTS